MGTKESICIKSLKSTNKIFFEVNTDILDLDRQIQILTDELKVRDNEILKLKLSILLRTKALELGKTVRNIVQEYNNSNPSIRITEQDMNKRVAFNNRMIDLFKKDRVLFEAYRSIILDLGYKVTTLQDNLVYFDKEGVIEDLTSNVISNTVNHIIQSKSDKSIFSELIEMSSVTRECAECKRILPISKFKMSKCDCRECSRIKELNKEKGEDAVKAYLTRQCTKTTEENIKEFKNCSEKNQETIVVSYSRNYLDIRSQLESLNEFLDAMYYTDASGMSFEESLDINIKCVGLNKKLLELEEKIYAEQLSNTK